MQAAVRSLGVLAAMIAIVASFFKFGLAHAKPGSFIEAFVVPYVPQLFWGGLVVGLLLLLLARLILSK